EKARSFNIIDFIINLHYDLLLISSLTPNYTMKNHLNISFNTMLIIKWSCLELTLFIFTTINSLVLYYVPKD
ncbi:MAG: hypothetical protein R3321_12375, partial [Nitrososphaeraceae archaeon]|nr:hypothetical protein [Nitrososphaeraceae archaeon]